jgi:DNA-binding NarL/FixJ family response regulator
MDRIPILIADDHAQVRGHILARLEREALFQVVGIAENSRDTIGQTAALHPALVLIDPHMRDGHGLDAIREIRAASPDTAVVVLSAFTDTAQKIELEKLGVACILNKGIESYKLVDTLQRAAHSPQTNGKE